MAEPSSLTSIAPDLSASKVSKRTLSCEAPLSDAHRCRLCTAERAAPGAPPDETEREMHAMLIRQIEAQRNGADGSFLARDWLKEAGTRPARCE